MAANIRKLIIAIIIASTLFLNASLSRESTEPEADEADPPPDYIDTTYEVPSLADASQAIADVVAARLEAERIETVRLAVIEKQRLADEAAAKAEAERLVVVEKERLAALEAEREAVRVRKSDELANKPTEPSRSSDYVGQAQAFSATAYTAYCEGCSGITKTGVNLRNSIYHEGRRVIAVDPRRVALGSIVLVTLADGSSFEALAEDVGSAIQGGIIDIAHETKEQALRFGRQSVEVRVIRKGR